MNTYEVWFDGVSGKMMELVTAETKQVAAATIAARYGLAIRIRAYLA